MLYSAWLLGTLVAARAGRVQEVRPCHLADLAWALCASRKDRLLGGNSDSRHKVEICSGRWPLLAALVAAMVGLVQELRPRHLAELAWSLSALPVIARISAPKSALKGRAAALQPTHDARLHASQRNGAVHGRAAER